MSLEEAEVDSPDDVEGEFNVEKILNRRVRSGRVEYFLKWKGFDDTENTWEPEGNLDCPELIEEFENNRKAAEASKKEKGTPKRTSAPLVKQPSKDTTLPLPLKRKAGVLESSPTHSPTLSPIAPKPILTPSPATTPILSKPAPAPAPVILPPTKVGFERGLAPDVIIGATDSGGSLKFLIMWEGCGEADLVPAAEANSKCPQLVIAFYEERLSWRTTLQDEDV